MAAFSFLFPPIRFFLLGMVGDVDDILRSEADSDESGMETSYFYGPFCEIEEACLPAASAWLFNGAARS